MSWDKTIIAAVIGGFFVIIAAIIPIMLNQKQHPDPTGSILVPEDEEIVERVFLVSGVLANVPNDRQIWLAVEKNNLVWPKEPNISSADRKWSRAINENEITGKGTFSLSLFCVPPKGQKVFENWFENGKRTGEYPGLKEIKGAFRLDIVNNLKLVPEKNEDITGNEQIEDKILYRTETGKCYHREGCTSLKKSKITIKLSEAKKYRLKPCKKCKPPE
jgi:hypothetical protein